MKWCEFLVPSWGFDVGARSSLSTVIGRLDILAMWSGEVNELSMPWRELSDGAKWGGEFLRIVTWIWKKTNLSITSSFFSLLRLWKTKNVACDQTGRLRSWETNHMRLERGKNFQQGRAFRVVSLRPTTWKSKQSVRVYTNVNRDLQSLGKICVIWH